MEKRQSPQKENQRPDSAHFTPIAAPRRVDVQRAVRDIREAAERIAHLTAKNALPEVEVRS